MCDCLETGNINCGPCADKYYANAEAIKKASRAGQTFTYTGQFPIYDENGDFVETTQIEEVARGGYNPEYYNSGMSCGNAGTYAETERIEQLSRDGYNPGYYDTEMMYSFDDFGNDFGKGFSITLGGVAALIASGLVIGLVGGAFMAGRKKKK